MSSILVLGGAGFIGSNFTRYATKHYNEIVVLDKLTYAGRRENLNGIAEDIEFVEGDIRDRELLNDYYVSADHIINFAAESHVDRSINDGRNFVQSNVEGAFVAMDALRDHDIDRFVQLSTDEVYGSIAEGTSEEGDFLNPSSPYSASKASADMFVNAFWETYDSPISAVRPTNVYGPRQHPEKLIPKFILLANRGDLLPVYGDGSNVRQWLFVEDLCEALIAVLDDDKDDIYNVGGTVRKSNLEVTKAILDEVTADESLIEFVDDRKGHDQRYALDDSKFRDRFDISAETSFSDGLRRTVEWYTERSSPQDG
jgi:dTDP-glucose 4,6-dehydratase